MISSAKKQVNSTNGDGRIVYSGIPKYSSGRRLNNATMFLLLLIAFKRMRVDCVRNINRYSMLALQKKKDSKDDATLFAFLCIKSY